jgi:uncharacterized protein YjbI with pentapeptide repeats
MKVHKEISYIVDIPVSGGSIVMRKFTPEELKKILEDHKLWLNDHSKGARANLRYADLSFADLRSADLRYSDLRNADLSNADLSYSDLSYSDIRYSNFSYSDLSYANLRYSDLRNADLSNADLSYSDLSYSDIRYSNFSYSDLSYSNFSYSDLSYSDIRYSDLSNAKLRSEELYHQICPEIGSFTAFKKVKLKDGYYESQAILTLEIPAEAKRTNAIYSRKCRAEKALVIKAENISGAPISETAILYSSYDSKFIYKINLVATAEGFSEDTTEECGKGIAFFITRKEAEGCEL